ncbi:hypothetical protein KOR42_11850 [Thalassoglobus neptunius]|uniref:Uncharacterized protein n=1 Tax=Thalassoglobus neptunius TaxID=1938619 RepID=A0A5C5X513_9PLAN|nr:hypothetical protein KOR42_11850 [Thalassoglobus neptunius]
MESNLSTENNRKKLSNNLFTMFHRQAHCLSNDRNYLGNRIRLIRDEDFDV